MTSIFVRDFGPIARAEVQLKPLTVFIGPNNSGKSYLALAAYCLSQTFSSNNPYIAQPLYYPTWQHGRFLTPDLTRRAEKAIKTAWPTLGDVPRKPTKFRDFPLGIKRLLSSANRNLANAVTNDFARELERCFGADISNLVRRQSDSIADAMTIGVKEPAFGFEWQVRSSGSSLETHRLKINRDHIIDLTNIGIPIRALYDDPEYFLYAAFREHNSPIPVKLFRKSHYMPASRSGILLGHKTLAGLIVGQASSAWLHPIEVPRLPGVVTDLIQALLLLSRIEGTWPRLEAIVDFLEKSVTRGTVGMDTSLEYPEVYYENQNGRFSFHQVSSMVSETAPIILFLKHLVREGHLFIIEEPESHIDAENQRKLARAVAMLVNADVNVLITTHSDYFVNQLNNLILLSKHSQEVVSDFDYSATDILKPEQIGAYQFNPTPGGSRVRKLTVSIDGGIPTDQYTNAHADIYDEAISLEQILG